MNEQTPTRIAYKKCESHWFQQAIDGLKTFEVREWEERLVCCDQLVLSETLNGYLTGRKATFNVTYRISTNQLLPYIGKDYSDIDWLILGIELVAVKGDTQ